MPYPKTRLAFLRDCCVAVLFILCLSSPQAAEDDAQNKGMFLVATEQLDGTSFQRTVILVTHFSPRGTVGLAINRPTDISLREALPEVGPLPSGMDVLFLGGPINAELISVLMRTTHPVEGMRHIAADLYLASGQTAFAQPIEGSMRIYAGYAGWAPGQLQAEVERGDWKIIKEDPLIIFEENAAGLWPRLYRLWSGNWI